MDKIRFGIVGYGHVGNKHRQHILAHPDAELIAVCDMDYNKTKSIKNTGLHVFELLEDMLTMCQLDVLCVCTPNYLHCVHTLAGLENNCHVVVEKPMAIMVSDCEKMIEKATKKKKSIFTVMQNRYAPSAKWLKKLIEQDALGKIFQIQVNCIWNRNQEYYSQGNWRGKQAMDGGVLFTQFSHFIDILYYLHGDIRDYIGGITANFNHPYTEIEDSGSFVMYSQKNAIVNFNYSICSHGQNMESSLTIIAEKGTIRIGGQYLDKIEYNSIENTSVPMLETTAANDYGFYQGSMNNHDKIIANVIDNLMYGKLFVSSAEDGKAVVNIIENMYKTAKRL
ncbi:MAG: Gfo/Idh/MocA family oxidoreductase [Chitinophagaceae bacterium]